MITATVYAMKAQNNTQGRQKHTQNCGNERHFSLPGRQSLWMIASTHKEATAVNVLITRIMIIILQKQTTHRMFF